MKKVFSFWSSTVGKKVVMAVTGLIMVGFTVLHMVGNLKAFMGPTKFDAYAHYLRTVGEPVFGYSQALWILRIVLIISVVLHAVSAAQLARLSRVARPTGYKMDNDLTYTYASKSMRWGGLFLLAFIVLHILHFTTGEVHPGFVEGAAHQNLLMGLQVAPVAALYILAMIIFGLHLFHGIWSAFQTLGLNNPRLDDTVRKVSIFGSVLVALGFTVIPIAVLTGYIG